MNAIGLHKYKNVNRVLYQQVLLLVPKISQIKLITQYYNDLLASYFGINKTRKFSSQKYY